MRSIVLCVAVSFVLIVSRLVAKQTAQDHPPVHADQVVGTLGARELAVKRFMTLPKGILFLRLENFSTKEAAQRAETPASAVVEWAGKVWLLTLGPRKERSRGGTFVAEIGPVPAVPPAGTYVLDVNEADFGPDMKAEVARAVHTHPGPEIF